MAGPFSRLLLTFLIGLWWLNILPPNLFFRQRPTTGNDSFCRYLVWPHQLLPKQLLAVNPTFQSHISELRCIYGWLAVFCNPRIFLAPATWASPMHPEFFSPVTLVCFFCWTSVFVTIKVIASPFHLQCSDLQSTSWWLLRFVRRFSIEMSSRHFVSPTLARLTGFVMHCYWIHLTQCF